MLTLVLSALLALAITFIYGSLKYASYLHTVISNLGEENVELEKKLEKTEDLASHLIGDLEVFHRECQMEMPYNFFAKQWERVGLEAPERLMNDNTSSDEEEE